MDCLELRMSNLWYSVIGTPNWGNYLPSFASYLCHSFLRTPSVYNDSFHSPAGSLKLKVLNWPRLYEDRLISNLASLSQLKMAIAVSIVYQTLFLPRHSQLNIKGTNMPATIVVSPNLKTWTGLSFYPESFDPAWRQTVSSYTRPM